MTDELDPRRADTSEQAGDDAGRHEPVAGATEEQEQQGDAAQAPRSSEHASNEELEAQAADDFFHDRPAATSARVFDPQGTPEN